MIDLSSEDIECLMLLAGGIKLDAATKWDATLQRLYKVGFVGRGQTPDGKVSFVIGHDGVRALRELGHAT